MRMYLNFPHLINFRYQFFPLLLSLFLLLLRNWWFKRSDHVPNQYWIRFNGKTHRNFPFIYSIYEKIKIIFLQTNFNQYYRFGVRHIFLFSIWLWCAVLYARTLTYTALRYNPFHCLVRFSLDAKKLYSLQSTQTTVFLCSAVVHRTRVLYLL